MSEANGTLGPIRPNIPTLKASNNNANVRPFQGRNSMAAA